MFLINYFLVNKIIRTHTVILRIHLIKFISVSLYGTTDSCYVLTTHLHFQDILFKTSECRFHRIPGIALSFSIP